MIKNLTQGPLIENTHYFQVYIQVTKIKHTLGHKTSLNKFKELKSEYVL